MHASLGLSFALDHLLASATELLTESFVTFWPVIGPWHVPSKPLDKGRVRQQSIHSFMTNESSDYRRIPIQRTLRKSLTFAFVWAVIQA